MPDDDDSRVSILEEEWASCDRIGETSRPGSTRRDSFAKRAGGYEGEAVEQIDRLASIKGLPKNPDSGKWQWPFSERNLGLDSPSPSSCSTS